MSANDEAPKPVKVVGYGRASTDKQEISPEVQKQLCEQWYEQQVTLETWPQGSKWLGCLIDPGVSSRIPLLMRPQGQFILNMLDPGDVVVVAKDNRAFRSAADCEHSLEKLKEAGIRMIILNMNVDTFSPEGQAIISVLSSFGRLERERIRQNTKEALAMRKQQGRPYGPAPPGWLNKCDMIPGQGKVSSLVPDLDARRVGAYSLRRIREGASTEDVYGELMKMTKRWGRKNPYGRQTLVFYAVYHKLDWPKMSRKEVVAKFGKVFNVDFIRSNRKVNYDI